MHDVRTLVVVLAVCRNGVPVDDRLRRARELCLQVGVAARATSKVTGGRFVS